MNRAAKIKPELLAPAGDMNRLAVALAYGADAVYLSGKTFGMRAACKNFDYDELKRATELCHKQNKRVYVTLNIFPYDDDLTTVDGYLDYLDEIGVDGVIVSDLGLIRRIVKRTKLNVHVSTQANVLNADTANVYADMGAKRIVLARELNIERIKDIRDKIPSAVELECFVHGAMCISYSGRCLISAYLTGRSANRGECNQACRMRFTPEAGSEALEFVEDDGTYIFGGNDLNMIEHLDELSNAGVSSFKIEGRVKSEYYVGCIVNAYRRALNAVERGDKVPDNVINEPYKAPNRGFNTGFYYGQPIPSPTITDYYEFCGLVTESNDCGAVVEMRNRFKTGETLEILSPDEHFNTKITVPVMRDEGGNEVTDAKVPATHYILPNIKLPPLSMLRRSKQR